MLKLRFQSTVAALALFAATPVQAQLSGKLDAAEQKLAQDSQSCTPINLGDYQSLLNEAAKNKKRAEKAKKAGVPVDDAQVNADLAKASALFNRALAAHVQQCVRQATAQSAQPPSQAMNLSPFEKTMLAIHNAMRAKYGAAPLEWAPGMAVGAAAWAGIMAQTGRVEHSPREGRGTDRENLARAPLNYSDAQIIDGWVKEEAEFVPGTFPNVCKSGGICEGVLHIAQMIWPTTIRIGCGKAVGNGGQYVVCRYGPGGNKPGKIVGIPPATNLADAGSKLEQPALPPTEVFNSSIRPRLIGGDYSGGKAAVAQGQTPKIASEHPENKMSGQFYAPLFDLGIYAGGAYTTDWFEIGEPDDDQMTWGVDLDVVEKYIWRGIALGRDVNLQPSNWVSAYDFSAPVWSQIASELVSDPLDPDDPLGSGIYWDPVSQVTIGPGANYVDAAELGDQATTVEQPVLKPAEVFNPNTPKVAASDKQEPSNPLPRCGGFSFFDAVKLYQAAKDKGDSAGMIAAKGLMAHGIASQRQSVEDAVATYEVAPKGLSPAGFMAVLDGMMSQYEELTGEQAPGTYDPPEGYELADGVRKPTDTAVEQPVMPPTEVFKAAEQQHYCADVM